MAAAKAQIYGGGDLINGDIKTTPLGWNGTGGSPDLGTPGDFVTLTSGYIEHATTAGAIVATSTKVGVLMTPITSSDAAASANALAVQYLAPGPDTEFELSMITSGTDYHTLQDVSSITVGTVMGLARMDVSPYSYAADSTGTVTFVVTRVNKTRGTLFGKIADTVRLK